MVVTSLIVWPAAPLFLFMHGKDINIAKGTPITAYVDGDFTIGQTKARKTTVLQSEDSSEPAPAQVPAVANTVVTPVSAPNQVKAVAPGTQRLCLALDTDANGNEICTKWAQQ